MIRSAQAKAQDGYVMVITMVVLAFALLVGGVALSATINNRGQSTRQARAERAQQAVDAGIQATLYRLNNVSTSSVNLYASSLSTVTNAISCLGLDLSVTVQPIAFVGISPAASCAGSTGTPRLTPVSESFGNRTTVKSVVLPILAASGNGRAMRYAIIAWATEDNGTASTDDDITRRSIAYTNTIEPFHVVEGVHDVTLVSTGLSLLGLPLSVSTTVNGTIRAGHELEINSLAVLGLDISALTGGTGILAKFEYGCASCFSGPLIPLADLSVNSAALSRPAVTISPSKPTCSSGAPCPPQINASTHVLTVPSGTVTLGPGDYVFCGVSVASGATLNTVTSGAVPTRIYVDSPTSTRCSGVAGAGNVAIAGNFNFGVNVAPTMTQLYVAGNGTPNGTSVTIGASGLALTTSMFVYAPMSNTTVYYTVFTGSVIGYDVTMRAASTLLGLVSAGVLTQNLGLTNQPLANTVGSFRLAQTVECQGSIPSGTAYAAGC